MNNTKIVELVIEDDNQELAIDAISLVSAPAIEQDFVFFGKQKNNLTFAKVDEEKRMLISPALIPNKQIFRYDPNTDSDYYVYFSKATVRKASELYLKHNNHHKATYEHKDRVSGVLTVESWIIEDTKMDKSTLYGFSLPKGTWMVKMKIENDDLWKKIKDGELKGLSIEGYFTNKFEQMQKKEPTTEQILSALNEMLQSKTELKSKKIELSYATDSVKYTKDLLSESKKLREFGSKATAKMETTVRFDNDVTEAKKTVEEKTNALDAEWKKLKSISEQMEKTDEKFWGTLRVAENMRGDFLGRLKDLGISPNESKDYQKLSETITATRKIGNASSFNIIQWTKKLKNLDY
jgi:hypothetical protein